MYLLFYSKYCKYSDKFLELVKKIHYEAYFEKITADKVNGKRHPFISKYNVREVPTIIVDQRIYAGKEAFKWLQSKIKNSNNSLPVHNTRQNKIQHISGYMPEISALHLEDEQDFDGNSQYRSLHIKDNIQTPAETENIEKSTFVLPSDSITSIKTEDVKKPDRSDDMSKQYKLMEEQRKKQDAFFSKQQPMQY